MLDRLPRSGLVQCFLSPGDRERLLRDRSLTLLLPTAIDITYPGVIQDPRLVATESMTGRRLRSALDLLATIALIAAAGAVLWSTFLKTDPRLRADPTLPVPTKPLSIADAPTIGSDNARIALVLFSDFQCPYCGRFAQSVLPSLKQAYVDRGLLQIAFRHLPLDRLHPRARPAAEAAECARRQNKFWEVHDSLFRDAGRLERDDLLEYGRAANLDEKAYAACLEGQAAERVRQDAELAKSLEVRSTPSVFLGVLRSDQRVVVSRAIQGARSIGEFSEAIESVLESLN